MIHVAAGTIPAMVPATMVPAIPATLPAMLPAMMIGMLPATLLPLAPTPQRCLPWLFAASVRRLRCPRLCGGVLSLPFRCVPDGASATTASREEPQFQ